MALSTPPPPPDPPSSSTTTTTTTRPVFPNTSRPPTPQPHPFSLQYPPTQQPQRVPPSSNLLYPVASTGRGFLPKPAHNYPNNRSVVTSTGTRSPFALNHVDPGSVAGVIPTHLQHALIGSSPNANSAVIKGLPVVTSSSHPKIASTQPSVSDCNGFREGGRDRSKDGIFATIRDRRVRISDNASLYALCRSWLRNGLPDEIQVAHDYVLLLNLRLSSLPQYVDGVMSLPRPLPLAPQDAESQKEGDKEEEEEDGESVEHLSPKELLQRHVKRAKRIRSRLREERLRRIARYKTRLAHLLHRNEPASGN